MTGSKCETIYTKMSSAYKFMNGFTLRLILKQRHKGTRKWPMHKQTLNRARLATFLNSIPISFSNNATFWLSHVSTPNKSASISWNSSCVINPADWSLVWSLNTDPRLVSHFLRAILSGMCVINLNIRVSRWWMSNSSSKRRGSNPLVLLKNTQVIQLRNLDSISIQEMHYIVINNNDNNNNNNNNKYYYYNYYKLLFLNYLINYYYYFIIIRIIKIIIIIAIIIRIFYFLFLVTNYKQQI